MLTVYDLEDKSISEMILLGLSPIGSDPDFRLGSIDDGRTKIEEEKKSFLPLEEKLTLEEMSEYNNLMREKLTNLAGERRLILNIIDDVAFGNNRPYRDAFFSNEEELMDYAVENIWKDVYRQIRAMENRFMNERGLEHSVMLDAIKRYKHPKKMVGFKSHARKHSINVRTDRYSGNSRHLPVLRQISEKTPQATASKWTRKLTTAVTEAADLMEVADNIRDYVRAMIVTPHAHSYSGPFSPTGDSRDVQGRIIQTLISDNRIELVGKDGDLFTDKYKVEGDDTLMYWQAYMRLSQEAADRAIHDKVIRYPSSYTGKDSLSVVLIDARNYFEYFFGVDSHVRYKTKSNLTDEEKMIRDNYQEPLERMLDASMGTVTYI